MNDPRPLPPPLVAELTSRVDELPGLAARVDQFADAAALPEASRYQLQLVLEELFVNFVTHGHCPDGCMSIQVQRTGQQLHIQTSDDGVPFNPLLVAPADTAAPLEQRPIGGLGIHLMRQLGDNLCYERAHERNIVRMDLRLEG